MGFAIAQQSMFSTAPAVRQVIAGDSAAGVVAGTHLNELKSALDQHWPGTIFHGSVSQLAIAVQPPAEGPVISSDAAAVPTTRYDRPESQRGG
jgi:hypothetical protein